MQVLHRLPHLPELAGIVLSLLRPEDSREAKEAQPLNRHQTMLHTNKLAKDWLLENGYDDIWLKPHYDARKPKFKETYLTREGVFYSRDIYNLFDGICFDKNGMLVFLQLSTAKFHPEEPYHDFCRTKTGFEVLMIMAVKTKSRWQVKTKTIRCPMQIMPVN